MGSRESGNTGTEKNNKMRIFISGPMRGVPNFNYPRFNAVAQILRDQGHEVVNPVEVGKAFGKPERINADEGILREVVKAEAALVPTCDAICLLKGWQRSVGAKRELQIALAMGMEVLVEDIDNSCRIERNDTGGRPAFGFRMEAGPRGADRTEVRRNKRENEKMKKATKKPVLNVKKSSAKTVTNKKAARKPAKKAK